MDTTDNRRPALICATLSSFLIPYMLSSINIALPVIGKEFAMDAVLLNWAATSYLLSTAMFLVPLGKIADIYGRKRVFGYGVSIYTLSSFLLTFSNSAAMLILLRVVQGIGAAMIFSTGVAILTSVFPIGERGKALGVNVTAVYLGYSLGPFFGGYLTSYIGWRSIFLTCVPIGLVILGFVFWGLKGEWSEAKGEGYDILGAITYGLTLVAVMVGFSRLPKIPGIVLVALGIAGVVGFVAWETRTKHPVMSIGLFKDNRVFTFSNLAALISYSATFAVTFLLSLYLQYIQGLSPKGAGLVLVSQPLTQAIFSPFAGRLSDRVEPRIVASIGMGFTTLGLFLFIFLDDRSSLWFILAALFLLGLGFALFSSPNINAVMSSVEKKFYGVASAVLGTMRLVGQTLSMGITMVIFAVYIGRVEMKPEYYPFFLVSMKVAFSIFTALCFGGVFASLTRGKLR